MLDKAALDMLPMSQGLPLALCWTLKATQATTGNSWGRAQFQHIKCDHRYSVPTILHAQRVKTQACFTLLASDVLMVADPYQRSQSAHPLSTGVEVGNLGVVV